MRSDLRYIKYYHLAKNMFEREDSLETIAAFLSDKEIEPLMIAEIVKQVKDEHAKAKHTRGLTILLIGLIILLISFVLTCINFHANESITYVMFGISSVGLIVIFIGLYDLFG